MLAAVLIPLELRVTGGRYRTEGRLEVREKGKDGDSWGTICGHSWDMRETMVVCREMGFNYAKQPLKVSITNYFGGHEIEKKYYSFNYLPDLIPDTRALEDSVRLQDRPLYYLQCALEENCLSSSAYVIRNSSRGLSVNCSDNYLWDIDCQWIDITDIEPGSYTFLIEVNPSLLVAELDYDNNVARCDLWYSGYFAKFTNCRLESLLDYRRFN
nr:hypothetical protein BaRGS_008339 [Batillaria attramentaria]